MYFLESVLGKDNAWWKYVVTFIGAFIAANIIGSVPLLIVIFVYAIGNKNISIEEMQAMDFSSIGISENLFFFLLLIPFVIGLFFAYLFIKYLHGRRFSETVNGTKRIRWRRIFTGFSVWLLLMLIYLAVCYIVDPDNFVLQFDVKTFIPLFFITILFIPIQTTFEELMFRGYLAQGIAAWTKNRWLVVIIPAILFGLMHIMNPEVSTYGIGNALPQYMLFGLLFGFISVWDDGIELTIGMHAANNIFACLFVTFEASALKTSAVFKQQSVDMQMETIVLLVAGLLALLFFAKKYKWTLSLINKKIKPVEETDYLYK
jgi:membrane protease YdiL (CAAX protease family)